MIEPKGSPVRRVTVVAHELRGFLPVGGMGTATTFLTLALARMGHAVEILLGMHPPESIDPYWDGVYREAGVRIRSARAVDEVVQPWYFRHTLAVARGLQADPPDVVVAHDFGAPAYAALRLRQAGLAFEDALFVIFCHGTRRYIMDLATKVGVDDLDNLLAFAIQERAAIELADVLVSPSAYLVAWMRGKGWRLPERTFVIPYFTRSAATGEPVAKRLRTDRERLERLAFFGRLDEKKGLEQFAAGVNALEPELLDRIELEFLGKATPTWPPDRIEGLFTQDAKRALRGISFETQLDQHGALARLSSPGTLAIMPSLQENSPNAVYECLEHGIPFVASNVGGVPELVAPADRARVLFEPTAQGVEAALRRVLSDRDMPPPAEPAHASDAAYEGWAEVLELRVNRRRSTPEGRVDVVVAKRGSPEALARSLAALQRQTHAEIGVTVVEGASVEAARAAGLRSGSAEYVLFLDEEDIPDDDLVATLLSAEQGSGADVVTCGQRLLTDGGTEVHLFLGEPEGLGVRSNAYGTVALFRRELFADLTMPWPTEGDPDWPLLARLSIAGARIVSVPLPLVTRGARPGSVERDSADALLVAAALERALPEPLRSTARLAAGLAADTAPQPARSPGFARRVRQRLSRGVR